MLIRSHVLPLDVPWPPPSQASADPRPGGRAQVAAQLTLRQERSLVRQAWQREMERAQMAAWSVGAIEATRLLEPLKAARTEVGPARVPSTPSSVLVPSNALSNAPASSAADPISPVASRMSPRPHAAPQTGSAPSAPTSSGTRSVVAARLDETLQQQTAGLGMSSTDRWQPAWRPTGSGDPAPSARLASDDRPMWNDESGHGGQADAPADGLGASSLDESSLPSRGVLQPVAPSLVSGASLSTVQSTTTAAMGWPSQSTWPQPAAAHVADSHTVAASPVMQDPVLTSLGVRPEKFMLPVPKGPALVSWRQGLDSSASPQVSVHAETSSSGGVNLWLGMPRPDVQAEPSLLWLVQSLYRQLNSQGIRLHRVVCNGRLVWADDAPAHANQPFIDFSGHVNDLAASNGLGDHHT